MLGTLEKPQANADMQERYRTKVEGTSEKGRFI